MAVTTDIPKRESNLEALYENYGTTSDQEIKKLLEEIVPVIKTHKGEGTVFGLYELHEETMKRIKERPRGVSFTYSPKLGDYRDDLSPFKIIHVLVQSSSRVMFKPDIGEVYDQMTEEEKEKAFAVFLNTSRTPAIEGRPPRHSLCKCLLYEKK